MRYVWSSPIFIILCVFLVTERGNGATDQHIGVRSHVLFDFYVEFEPLQVNKDILNIGVFGVEVYCTCGICIVNGSFWYGDYVYSKWDGCVTWCVINNGRNLPVCNGRLRLRRHSRPCAYYANSSATFHLPLIGDLIFKLNPGPLGRHVTASIPVINAHKEKCSKHIRNSLNLINITCSATNSAMHGLLSLCLLNAQSIRNKTANFVDYVCDYKHDLVAVTETWLRTADDAIRVELCPVGYKFIDFPRKGRNGGGIGLLYRDYFKVAKVRNGEEKSFEYCELLVQASTSCKIRVVIVYRPPYNENHRVSMGMFINEFSNYMDSIILSKEQLLILGDFNIHLDDSTNADTKIFIDLLESLGLEQHVKGPTHIHGHTLDLVITRKMETVVACPPRVCRQFIVILIPSNLCPK